MSPWTGGCPCVNEEQWRGYGHETRVSNKRRDNVSNDAPTSGDVVEDILAYGQLPRWQWTTVLPGVRMWKLLLCKVESSPTSQKQRNRQRHARGENKAMWHFQRKLWDKIWILIYNIQNWRILWLYLLTMIFWIYDLSPSNENVFRIKK